MKLRMTESLRDRVKAMADQQDVSVNKFLVKAVENYLQWKERTPPPTRVVRRPVAAAVAESPSEDLLPPPAGGVYVACPCGSGKKYRFCHGGKAK
ncbi:SEC-C metal-binding domain-containing protein [Pseudoxanthomonas mexicana]|uniref:SEC-C metal-binding domain-containing protein n=1 Tax=Pseudoxanthomonas mexicana TaxID=128785 RepID=UPI0012ECC5D5|nr:SEC-C metal-binding domain-containing protein [Pseudoxanthomonas mexicana]